MRITLHRLQILELTHKEYKITNDKTRKKIKNGDFLGSQWLRICASNVGGMGLILGGGTKIP